MQVRLLSVSPNGPLAQLAEHLTLTQRVLGSNPRGSSNKRLYDRASAHRRRDCCRKCPGASCLVAQIASVDVVKAKQHIGQT